MLRLAVIHFLTAVGLKLWPYCEPVLKRYKGLGFILFILCILGIMATVLTGCVSGQLATKDPLYRYRADMKITVDGVKFDGMGVTTLDGPKTITIKSKARLDLLKISSCHREFVKEKIDYEKGWFGLGGKSAIDYTFVYEPQPIEKEFHCPLYIEAFQQSDLTRIGTMAAWGYLAFRTKNNEGIYRENLPATMECNGGAKTFKGISACQARAGMEQAISFDEPISEYLGNSLCKITKVNEKEFRVRSDVGFCQATFRGTTFQGKKRRAHRLVLLGYEDILVRRN